VSNDVNDNLATRIRRLMQQHGNISEAELARVTQLPQPTIHRLISGSTLDPRVSTLQALTDYFNVTFDYLLAKSPLLPLSELGLLHSGAHQLFPIIEWDEVITFLEKPSQITQKYSDKGDWATTDLAMDKNSFVLKTRASMEPRFSRGTLLFIEPNENAEDGDLVLAYYKKEQQLALRSVVIDGRSRFLQSVMSPSQMDAFDKDKIILGVVAQSKFTFGA
jgi:transcriptional regulator with XRE-family HTH domain